MLDLTSMLLYNGNGANLSIHNLVVWDSDTGSSWYGVVAFSSSYPPSAYLMVQTSQNKGVALTYNFNYGGAGNPYIWFGGAGANNTLRYRLT